MNVEKITIKKTPMTIAVSQNGFPFYREAIVNNIPIGSAIDEQVKWITAKYIYFDVRIIDSLNGMKKHYLVPVTDKKLFNELVMIGDDDIKRVQRKSYGAGHRHGRKEMEDEFRYFHPIKSFYRRWYYKIKYWIRATT